MIYATDAEDAARVLALIESTLSRIERQNPDAYSPIYVNGQWLDRGVAREIAAVRMLATHAARGEGWAWELLDPMWTMAIELIPDGGGDDGEEVHGEETDPPAKNVVQFRRMAA